MDNTINCDIPYAERERDFLFYGLLVYTVLFYSQVAGRFQVLAPLRIELILGSVMVLFSLARIFSRQVEFSENRLNLAAFLFIAAAFITIPFALVKSRALEAFIHLLKFFSIYLMIVAAIDSERKLKIFVYVYLCMISLLFVEPFILSLQGKGFIYNNHMMRLAGVTGYFQHPNQLGGITAENLAFFYYLMRHEKSMGLKLLCFTLMVIAVYVVMLTQSRTGFLGLIAVSFGIWLFSRKKILALGVIILCSVVAWQFASPETRDRFLTLSNISKVMTLDELGEEVHQELGSMQSRQELIRRGLIAFAENPILGLGLKCFISFNGQRWGYWFPPHNTYIQALAEMGIVGFTVFSLVIVLIFRNLKRSRDMLGDAGNADDFLSDMTSALTVYLIARLVVSFFGQDLYANYWWIAGGLSVVILRVAGSQIVENSLEET